MSYKTYDEIVDVKLLSYSQPSSEFAHLKCDDSKQVDGWDDSHVDHTLTNLVSYCARVSNPANQNNVNTSEKLIGYLLKNKHFSPFEMVNVCLEVTTTRDIARQILRHRSFSFQEYSQRYADPTKDLEFCIRECRMQDTKNRQNSVTTDDNTLQLSFKNMQIEMIDAAKANYEWAISAGIAKEVARVILPEGNTVSRLYINGTLRSFVHFLEVRLGNGTQKEHMMVARECAKVISQIFPYIKTQD